MTNKLQSLGAIALLVIGLLLGIKSGSPTVNVSVPAADNSSKVAGTSYDVSHLVGDVRQGTNDVLMIQNGLMVGPQSWASQVNGSMTVATSSGVQTLYTNTGIYPLLCSGDTGGLYATTTGGTQALASSLVASFGTTTATSGYAPNLLASSTMATGTPVLYGFKASDFLLRVGDSVKGLLSDGVANASSTYFASWSVKYALTCRALQ